jgi:hypothetical protein
MRLRASSLSERRLQFVLRALACAAAAALLAHFVLMLWARHELTQNESVVALHAAGLGAGKGLYSGINHYPYTVSPYMPSFYVLSAALQRLAVPATRAGRLISFTALLGIVALCWKILRLHGCGHYPAFCGTLAVASTANLSFWGTVGQVDVLGVAFSIAAFFLYSQYRNSGATHRLAGAGVFVLLALFTKQTMVAAPAAIVFLLALENRRRAALFALTAGGAGLAMALAINAATNGGFFENTIWANVIPFSGHKLGQQLQYLALAAGGLLVVALCGLRAASGFPPHPLYLYLILSCALLVATSPRIGADLNYQLEFLTVLGLCAGWTLHRLEFFPRAFRGDRSLVTLLHVPLLLHIGLNLAITGKTLASRFLAEHLRRQEFAAVRPYLEQSTGPILSVQMDPLVQSRLPIEVEPLIYKLLVAAGRVDPEPVRQDLASGKFGLVLLYENVFDPRWRPAEAELPSLPSAHLEAIRLNYRLVAHVPGALLEGDYLYQPIPAAAPEPEVAARR